MWNNAKKTEEEYKLRVEKLSTKTSGQEQRQDYGNHINEKKHKMNKYRDKWDDSKPGLSKTERPEKKFIGVNCSYFVIFKEVEGEILGTPSAMKNESLAKRKASNKWCDFYEDYGHLIKDFIWLKVRVDNHLQRCELTKYKKNISSSALVVATVPHQVEYINALFVRVDTVTKGRQK